MLEQNNLQQNTPEWLEFRRSRVGASDAPIIMEISPWKTPYQLWEEKVGIRENNFTSTAMKRGTNMEEEARQTFNREFGTLFEPGVRISKDRGWMIASLDGIAVDQKNAVEIKCPGKVDHAKALAGEIPEKYFPQLQHQLAVTELESLFYFSYSPESHIAIPIFRDDQYIAKMIKKETEFYECMQEFVPPKLSQRDYVERSDAEWQQHVSSYLQVREQLKSLEKQEADLKEHLIALAGKSNTMGAGIKLSKVVKKGMIDYSAIPELRSINLEHYRKNAIETWRIS